MAEKVEVQVRTICTFFAPFADQTMPNIAKDCHENKKNKSSKNKHYASKYAEIEAQKFNDKNIIHLPRQNINLYDF